MSIKNAEITNQKDIQYTVFFYTMSLFNFDVCRKKKEEEWNPK